MHSPCESDTPEVEGVECSLSDQPVGGCNYLQLAAKCKKVTSNHPAITDFFPSREEVGVLFLLCCDRIV